MLRAAAKSFAFRFGVLDYLHRNRNRECLTVVMLHRVLPCEKQSLVDADPDYTVTPKFLVECLDFMERRYTIVSLEDVLLSYRRVTPLPPWPALITFDDGWHDNLDWGLSTLGTTPWSLFVATDAAAEPGAWWQEVLLRLLRSGRVDAGELCRLVRHEDPSIKVDACDLPPELRLLLLYARLSSEQRQRVLAPFEADTNTVSNASRTLNAGELVRLREAGVSIGAHSASHLPLTHVANAGDDMKRAREWLARTLDPECAVTMSFPHGRWNPRAAETARTLGYELLFTSDAVLNPCPSGWLLSDVIGRIPLATHDLSDGRSNFAPARMSSWLGSRSRHGVVA